MNISEIAKTAWASTKRHSPEVFTGLGIAGMLTAGIMAVRATPKALYLIDREEIQNNEGYALNKKQKFKTAWKCYIPSVAVAAVSTACLITAQAQNLRRNAALATAYTLSETALKEYQAKVVETIGDKKEQRVRDEIAKDKVEAANIVPTNVIITDKGNTLCYDVISGRTFKSDIDAIKKTVNELNRRLISDNYISLNDFYYDIGLDGIKIGEDLGWNVDDGLIDLKFSSQLVGGETPCLVMDYQVAPKYEYFR